MARLMGKGPCGNQARARRSNRVRRDPGEVSPRERRPHLNGLTFDAFGTIAREVLRPSGETEEGLVAHLVDCAWRLGPMSSDLSSLWAEGIIVSLCRLYSNRRFAGIEDLIEPTKPADDDHESPDDPPPWRGRLTLDPSVSDESPVVCGTWITVDQVITRILDGWSWADIFRAHPELCEDDLRACLAYAVEEE